MSNLFSPYGMPGVHQCFVPAQIKTEKNKKKETLKGKLPQIEKKYIPKQRNLAFDQYSRKSVEVKEINTPDSKVSDSTNSTDTSKSLTEHEKQELRATLEQTFQDNPAIKINTLFTSLKYRVMPSVNERDLKSRLGTLSTLITSNISKISTRNISEILADLQQFDMNVSNVEIQAFTEKWNKILIPIL